MVCCSYFSDDYKGVAGEDSKLHVHKEALVVCFCFCLKKPV